MDSSGQHPPAPSSLRYAGETYTEKAQRRFKENPWVPLGAIATTAAFSMAAVRMRQGQSNSFNIWLRWRLVFQGLTIAAVCAGTYSLGFNKGSDQNKKLAEERRRREEKIQRDREEFEKRVQGAMEEYEAEAGFARVVSEGWEKSDAPPRMTSRAEKDAREKEVRKLLANRATKRSRGADEPMFSSQPETVSSEQEGTSQSSKGWFSGWFGS